MFIAITYDSRRVDKRHLFMRFGIVDIVDGRHDDTFILDQINGVILTYRRAGACRCGLLLPCCFQFCSMLIMRDSW
jgi:hypothetical protein